MLVFNKDIFYQGFTASAEGDPYNFTRFWIPPHLTINHSMITRLSPVCIDTTVLSPERPPIRVAVGSYGIVGSEYVYTFMNTDIAAILS